MDYSFFALGLLGAFAGYIIGDFQRQSRYRREARANLARANARAIDRAAARARANRNTEPKPEPKPKPEPVADFDDDGRDWIIAGTLSRQARRRAVPRPDIRNRPGRYAARGDTRFPDAPPVVISRTAVHHGSV